MAEENNNIIVSRIQHRRGLKQDLPQPLRPGEIGFATDSRQVFIGGDPTDPHATQYNATSYFENTVGARDHTLSILDNQVIAFQVPFIKFVRGEFNGVGTTKSWNPTDARSIISSAARPESKYLSSDFPVFSAINTENIVLSMLLPLTNSETTIVIAYGPTDEVLKAKLAKIRVGDRVVVNNVPTNYAYVDEIVDTGTQYEFTVTERLLKPNTNEPIDAGSSLTFIPNASANISTFFLSSASATAKTTAWYEERFVAGSFKNSDVIVHKNGIKLMPDQNLSNTSVPDPRYDYTINSVDLRSNGTHTLTLRVPPTPKDELTVCYYDAGDVALAIRGVDRVIGNQTISCISSASSVESFYGEYNIPWYRQIPEENIRVSETSGLGYIGLQQKHIVCVADGIRVAKTEGLEFGKLKSYRLDQVIAATAVAASGKTTLTFPASTYTDLFIGRPELDLITNMDLKRYVYDQVHFVTDTNSTVRDVDTVVNDGSTITMTVSGEYNGLVEFNPVLSIDLSDKTTIQEAITVVNKTLVPIAAINNGTTPVQVFPHLDWLPQADDSFTAVYFTQKPSFTSVAGGGLAFTLLDDGTTLSALGLMPGTYTRDNSSVRSKLEQWLNSLLANRDVNLFTNIFTGNGETYHNFNTADPSYFGDYELRVNEVYGEIDFGSRQEAANFNYIVNSVYAESPYDRSEDDADGTRGLVNLKNNIEIETRESSGMGQKVLTYTSLDSGLVSNEYADSTTEIFSVDVSMYNAYIIDYSITEVAGQYNKYMRTGTLRMAARPDFTSGDPVALQDTFTSVHRVSDGAGGFTDNVVEPRFDANLSEDGAVVFTFKEQIIRDPVTGATIDTVLHTIGSDLRIKYIVRRWPAINQ